MNPQVTAFELRADQTLRKRSLSLNFPRHNEGHLFVLTNQRSKCHFLQDPEEQQGFEKASRTDKEKKMLFQYEFSAKVFSVTDKTGSKWEVRLLLSSSEIARLSSAFNLIGCFSTYLLSKESHEALKALLDGRKSVKAAGEISRAMAPFACLLEGDTAQFCAQLSRVMTEAVREGCADLPTRKAVMVAGGLAALLAAELAASMGGSNTFDYTGDKTEGQEDTSEQIQEMLRTFDIQVEQLPVSHGGKTVHIIFRNPCPDNWASGGRKCIESGETFEFGLCHKVFSISEGQFEIQFLQSLQESYDMIAVFHIAAFAEHLLMTKTWRKSLDVLLKEGQKNDAINELCQLASKFVCVGNGTAEVFLKSFRREMIKKWSNLKALPTGGKAIGVAGLLVAVMAAVKVKAIVDDPKADETFSDEDTDQLVPQDLPEIASDEVKNPALSVESVLDVSSESGSRTTYHEDTDPTLGMPSPVPCGPQECLHGVSSAVEPQGFPFKDSRQDPDEVNYPVSPTEGIPIDSSVGQVHDPKSGSRTTYDEDTDPTLGMPSPALDSSCKDVEKIRNQDTPKIGNIGDESSNDQLDSNADYPVGSSNVETCGPQQCLHGVSSAVEPQGFPFKDSRQDPDEVNYPVSPTESVLNDSSVGQIHDPESGSRTTYDEDADRTLGMPSPVPKSPFEGASKTGNQDAQNIGSNGDDNVLRNRLSQKVDKLDRLDHASDADQRREVSTHRPAAYRLFTMLLTILFAAIASFVLPTQMTSILFTGMALVLGVHLFLSRRS